MALPHDVTGLSAVCDCGISGSYSLTIFDKLLEGNSIIGSEQIDFRKHCGTNDYILSLKMLITRLLNHPVVYIFCRPTCK